VGQGAGTLNLQLMSRHELALTSHDELAQSGEVHLHTNRRGLQAVQPSARRERGKLRASTPRHFRAAPALVTVASNLRISSGAPSQ